MQTHQLIKSVSVKKSKRVGRGGKRGTYSGKGGKGQTARSGRNFRPIVREVLKRYPKLRGYKNRPVGFCVQTVSVGALELKFDKGDTVSPRTLVAKKMVARASGRYPQVKILMGGQLSKTLTVKGCAVSAPAKEMIEKAGGTIKA